MSSKTRITVHVPSKNKLSTDDKNLIKNKVKKKIEEETVVSRTRIGAEIDNEINHSTGKSIHRGHILNEIDEQVANHSNRKMSDDCDTILLDESKSNPNESDSTPQGIKVDTPEERKKFMRAVLGRNNIKRNRRS